MHLFKVVALNHQRVDAVAPDEDGNRAPKLGTVVHVARHADKDEQGQKLQESTLRRPFRTQCNRGLQTEIRSQTDLRPKRATPLHILDASSLQADDSD